MSGAGCPSGLSQTEVEQELGLPIAAMIPDLPREARRSANLGDLLAVKHRRFRQNIARIAQLVGATSDRVKHQ